MKQCIQQGIDTLEQPLICLSHDIHSHPELGLNEYQAMGFICDFMVEQGYTPERGLGSLDTAFRVVYDSGKAGPHIAFLAEYDALPEMGHACGHNIIATCAVGAFLGTAKILSEVGGKITLLGTPAEESHGGKVTLLKEGFFEGIEYALMIHPTSGRSLINRGGKAAVSITIDFHGKSAHSSDPSKGINALNAVLKTFANIDTMRPTFQAQDNINGIITHGGTAANIIPETASCAFSLRAETMLRLEWLTELVRRSAEGANLLIGTTMEMTVGNMYAERYPSKPICEVFKDNMAILGEEMFYPDPKMSYGSSDVGNVSIVIPAIHDYLTIAPAGINSHSKEFTQYSISPRGDEICIKGAKGLAMTAYDILTNEVLRQEIQRYHQEQIPSEY